MMTVIKGKWKGYDFIYQPEKGSGVTMVLFTPRRNVAIYTGYEETIS